MRFATAEPIGVLPRGPAGPAGITFQGVWSPNSTYSQRSVVQYQAALWYARRGSTGRTPGSDPTYWELFVPKGTTGATGATPTLEYRFASGNLQIRRIGDPDWADWVSANDIRGYSLLGGAGAPDDADGRVGDWYLNTDTGDYYGPKVGTSWGASTFLAKGASLLGANRAPQPSDGRDGDWWLDTSTGRITGPKVGGSWGSSVLKTVVVPVAWKAGTTATINGLYAFGNAVWRALTATTIDPVASANWEKLYDGIAVTHDHDDRYYTKEELPADPMAWASSPATLDIVPVEGLQPAGTTFTRASGATRFNRKGLMETVATDALRVDYDPVTGAVRGWLLEEARTNLLTYSEQFDNAAWYKGRALVVANAIIAPDGTMAADKVTEDTATGTHYLRHTATGLTLSNPVTQSYFVKAAEHSSINLQSYNAEDVSRNTGVTFNLNTGLFSGAGAGGGASQTYGREQLENGWWRVWHTVTLGGVGSTAWLQMSVGTGPTAGNGVSGIYLWGAQLEAGAFPTSYIPTTTAAATRAADLFTMLVGDWFNPVEGTLYVDFDGQSSGYPLLINRGGSWGPRMQINLNSSFAQFAVTTDAETVAVALLPSITSPTLGNKLSAAFAANNFAMAANGENALTDVTGTIPTGMTELKIGRATPAGGGSLNGHIRQLAYFPRRLPNSELQAMSA